MKMTEVQRLQYDSWDEYKHDIVPELFGTERFQSGAFLFRGCGDSDWSLAASFDRRFGALPTAQRLGLWKQLLQLFRATCEQHGVPESIVRDDTRLLAFGQHYGLPTRLLDWSLSPYVAAFFAFRQSLLQAPASGQVAIWVLDTASGIWSAELGVELVAPPALENIRLLNQAGRFTYARTPYLTLENYVEYSTEPGRPLAQIALPSAEAERALPDLEAMGVSAYHLFPDMTGLSESVSISVHLDAVAMTAPTLDHLRLPSSARSRSEKGPTGIRHR